MERRLSRRADNFYIFYFRKNGNWILPGTEQLNQRVWCSRIGYHHNGLGVLYIHHPLPWCRVYEGICEVIRRKNLAQRICDLDKNRRNTSAKSCFKKESFGLTL